MNAQQRMLVDMRDWVKDCVNIELDDAFIDNNTDEVIAKAQVKIIDMMNENEIKTIIDRLYDGGVVCFYADYR